MPIKPKQIAIVHIIPPHAYNIRNIAKYVTHIVKPHKY
jgi:hypothetical protein